MGRKIYIRSGPEESSKDGAEARKREGEDRSDCVDACPAKLFGASEWIIIETSRGGGVNRQALLLLLLTAVGLIFSLPPFPTGFIAAVALVPFFFFIRFRKSGEAFRAGYLVGLVWAAGTLYWIGWATVIGLIGALIYIPISFALYALFQAFLYKRWGEWSFAAVPFVWTGIEILFSWGEMGFPWNSLAHTQTYTPVLIQYASITGMFGVVFWICLLNVLFYQLLRKAWPWKRTFGLIAAILSLIVIPWIHGSVCVPKQTGSEGELKISLVQGNIDPYKKWSASYIDSSFTVYDRLTRVAFNDNPDMIVWPETAAPSPLRFRIHRLRWMKARVDRMGIPILTGAPDYIRENNRDPRIKTFNTAFLIRPDNWRLDSYAKMKLVPFGERVPLVGRFPFLYDLARKTDLDVGGFSPGDSIVVFEILPGSGTSKVRFSVIICYESIFPYLVRSFVEGGAQFLVVITNDGWFGNTSGPRQHAQIAVYRAIENRVWIARCANTGISEFIDPYGRIHSRTPFNREAVLTKSIALRKEDPYFVRHGTLFLTIILIADGLILCSVFFHPLRRGRTARVHANGKA